MPVKSYLAQAFSGRRETLVRAIAQLPHCEYFPAENEDIVVVVTDTRDEQEDTILQEALNELPELKNLSLVSGFMSNQEKE